MYVSEADESDQQEGILCNFCIRTDNIEKQREGAMCGPEEQAKRMVALSNSKLTELDVSRN